MIVRKMYKKFLKIIITNLFFILFIFNQSAVSKPIPPGSGEGDVPANILILLDSSASMHRLLVSGEAIDTPGDVVEDEDGNIILSQHNSGGIVKILTDTKKLDRTFAGNKKNFKGTKKDSNCGNQDSRIGSLGDIHISSNVQGVTGDVIFGNDHVTGGGKIVAITNEGICVDVISSKELGSFKPMASEVRTIGGEDHLFVTGTQRTCKKWKNKKKGKCKKWKAKQAKYYTKNLTTGVKKNCSVNGGQIRTHLLKTWRMTVDNSGNYIYFQYTGNIYRYALTKTGDNYCPSTSYESAYSQGSNSNQHRSSTALQISPDSDDTLYVVSSTKNVVQKLSVSSGTFTSITTAGTKNKGNNTEDAGALAADSVRFDQPYGLYVTATKIWVTDKKATIQEFNENDFTTASRDSSWQNEYGGSKKSRYEGAKEAILAVVSDSTLTSGANFGYGHWNSGESGKKKKSHRGGWQCHKNLTDCNYYRGWKGDHPEGTSTLCNSDSCLLVGISEEGHKQIPAALDKYGLAWGTDANAFSQMALEYYTDTATEVIDENSDCQLNYVIVIGDGAWKHHAQAAAQIETLRKSHDVKTIVVAYGGGLSGGPMSNFDKMAIKGSCDDASGGAKECEKTIVADTPQELKTQLQSKIQQIIAERLSFTAPSITATIQEGGSLYQAQFNYEQHGEWQGTILRKAIGPDGAVIHDVNHPGNWDAAKVVKSQPSRNIWTVLPGVSYIGNWDNWKTDNKDSILHLFDIMGHAVVDYHNTTSTCKNNSAVQDGNDDDIEGLISFIRGIDYFDYDGDCNIDEKRNHVLGDIYHSQLIEIGAPDALYNFNHSNEEAYWRSLNNYQSYISDHSNRMNLIYAGANDGMLHAFNAETGEEEWGFIPPFVAGKLPTIVNKELDGKIDTKSGGTNAIFGVDGSPVVHDVFMTGLNKSGDIESTPSWHTILFVPYGRGGAGFSVLDVTYPVVEPGQGPIHMFSVLNDAINNRVLVADRDGTISEHDYIRGGVNISESEEAQKASQNNYTAESTDGIDSGVYTEQDLISSCQTNSDASSGKFYVDGTNACYKGTTFTFNIEVNIDGSGNIPAGSLTISEGDDDKIALKSAKMVDGKVQIEFFEERFFNTSSSDNVLDSELTTNFSLQTSCFGSGTADPAFDYSQLGETWSTPRIFRIPDEDVNSITEDTYVAVMGGGMGNTFVCSGSALFIIDLEDVENPGALYGAITNEGPVKIVDIDGGIRNSLPSSPVVITPDVAGGIPWRGAMVYVNDLEGKITKINLTNSTKNGAKIFDQTTLFNLNSDTDNRRYSYHSMDATIGTTSDHLWLFGGTGNYERIGGGSKYMDNILYGVKDIDYPFFKHLNDVVVPLLEDSDFKSFVSIATDGALKAVNIEDSSICKDTTNDAEGSECPTNYDRAWVIHLDTVDGKPASETVNRYRKVSAAPTVYKGNVYYPVYQPAEGANRCNLGKAYICSADDECGTNNSRELAMSGSLPDGDDCYFVRRGILSELVVFGDMLYANVAGPSDTEDTLVTILSGSGDIGTYRDSWREH